MRTAKPPSPAPYFLFLDFTTTSQVNAKSHPFFNVYENEPPNPSPDSCRLLLLFSSRIHFMVGTITLARLGQGDRFGRKDHCGGIVV